MGHIADGLHGAFQAAVPHLVEHDGQQNGQREMKHDGISAQKQRVSDQPPAILGFEEGFEVLQAHKFASRNALEQLVILKGDDDAGHGPILE